MFKNVIAWNVKPNLYKINEKGEVLSIYMNKIMKTRLDKDGYPSLSLRNNKGGYSTFYIHRLLLSTFNPIENYRDMTVNHKNGIKTDFNLENLEWMTNLENLEHANRTGLHNVVGENHPRAKLTEKDIFKILDLLKSGMSGVSISKIYNVNESCISKIKNGNTWNHITHIK